MSQQKTVFYPPTINWNFLKQRPQQICSQFGRNGYKVIYCNQTFSNQPPVEVEKNVFVYHNFNQVLADIKSGKIKVDIFYYTWAKMKNYIDIIKPKLVIFDNVDLFPEWSNFEIDAIKTADILTCTSQYIYDKRQDQHSNVHLIRNGCDSSFIDRDYVTPKEMQTDEPKIVFVGAVGNWVSTYLIKKVADKYPNTYFIGKEFPKKCPSNVINLGMKNHNELPNYYYAANVCLLPFNIKQEVVNAANPIKQYEHMACGKPTVATSWHETEIYSDVVLSSKSDDEFMDNVDKAIQLSKLDSYRQRCFNVARENTWEVRFNQINTAIQQFFSSNL